MALLIGIVKGPSYYDPRRHPERARQRRDLALRRMLATHLIDQKEFDRALADVRPTLVVGLGLAGGRAEWTPERVAINVDDARIPDNAGGRPIDAPVVPGGPVGYFSTLPIKAIVHALRSRGLLDGVLTVAITAAGTAALASVEGDVDDAIRRRMAHIAPEDLRTVVRALEAMRTA